MAIPKFQEITLLMLKLAADGQIWSLADAREELAKHFQLTEEEIEELLPSGRQARFANRVAWAKVYLERGALLSSNVINFSRCLCSTGGSLLCALVCEGSCDLAGPENSSSLAHGSQGNLRANVIVFQRIF